MAVGGIGREGRRDLIRGRHRQSSLVSQLRLALVVLALIVGGGTIGYMVVEDWGPLDAFFMTIITLSTVGYGEVQPLTPAGKLLSIIVIISGVAAAGFAVGTAGRITLEDRIRTALGRKSMKAIRKLKGHYIICGFGRMGRIICEDLNERGVPFVVLENNEEVLEELERLEYLFLKGNATNDEELIEAGIEQAAGLVSVVTDDTQNVYIVLTARGLNPVLNIVARAAGEESVTKLVRAGANKVVSPYSVGGHRIAQAIMRPTVLDFLETIVQNREMELRLEEDIVSQESPLVGKTLAASGLRKDYNIIILAIKSATGTMAFNPPFDTEIKAGDTLVILGNTSDLDRFEQVVKGT